MSHDDSPRYSDFLPKGRSVPNMHGWSLSAAMRQALSLCPLTDDEIAARMGWSKTTANRIICNQDYWPSLPTLPTLCNVLGNAVIPRWIIDNADSMLGKSQPMTAPELFTALRQIMQAVAGLLEEGEKALEDGQIVSQEARRVLKKLEDMLQTGATMTAGLQAVIDDERERNRP